MESPRRIGKYEVIAQIATGGFGVIYKGWDPFIKRTVAIKMCATPDEEVRQRFHQEAQFVGNLVHRNITLVFDFGVEDGVPYIVQEFLSGYDLDELLRAGLLADPDAVVSILLQVCDGLDFAHHRGIIHRDIKPSNIRVLEDGTVKIMDFGIAKSLEAGSKLTQTGIALGTAGYLAPEQIQGGNVDARTDIFSLGVVAYELVTGKRPFQGSALSNVLYKILNDTPAPPVTLVPSCSPVFDEIIRRCMAKDPAERPQSARALFQDLRQVSVGELARSGALADHTTGVLRNLVTRMEAEASGSVSQVRTLSTPLPPPVPSTAPVDEGADLHHSPMLDEGGRRRRSPVLVTFLVLVGILAAAGAGLYLSQDAQRLVFGSEGAPWIPTPTPTPTATPTATPPPTATPEPSPTPTPEPTPTPGPVTVQLIVDPPAELRIDGAAFGSGRVSSGQATLRPGAHTFTLLHPGYGEKTLTREIRPDSKVVSLAVDVGQLTVVTDTSAPTGGVAFLDGRRLGTVPLVRLTVEAGDHELVVRWENSEPFRRKISVPRMPAPPVTITAFPGG